MERGEEFIGDEREGVGTASGHDYTWFIEEMNRVCKELGGENSNFVNTNGLHDPNHYTCARDMALIGREPVSYTHLDVYKRQMSSSSAAFVKCSIWASVTK